LSDRRPKRGCERDGSRTRGIDELARRLMYTARRMTRSESDAEDLVEDGFRRAFFPERPDGSPASTTYSREVEDIVERCARRDQELSDEDEVRISSFVFRLTMTTYRHLVRTRARTAPLGDDIAAREYAALDAFEEDLSVRGREDALITLLLSDLLDEIAKNRNTAVREALEERLRNEFEDPDKQTTAKDIAERHRVNPGTLASSWHRLIAAVAEKRKPC